VSPYVGLFGTVWGIMIAFVGLSSVRQATLAQVAPGHRRGADRHRDGAVRRDPPVVGYNRYTHDIDRLATAWKAHGGVFQHPAASGNQGGLIHGAHRKQVAQITFVPMIDVMLVLLVIFMVTRLHQSRPGRAAERRQTSQTPAQPLEVIIKASGEYVLKKSRHWRTRTGITKRELAPNSPRCTARAGSAGGHRADKSVRYEE